MAMPRIGQTNEQVTLQQFTRTADDSGGDTDVWVEAGSGDEVLRASRLQIEVNLTITIYYRSDVTEQWCDSRHKMTTKKVISWPHKRNFTLKWLC